MRYYKVTVQLSQNVRRILLLIAETRAETMVRAEMAVHASGEQSFVIVEAEEVLPDKYGVVCWTDTIS